MENAWGRVEDSDLKQIDFKLAMIQGLPQYYGAGNIRMNFVQMHQERLQSSRPNEAPFFDELKGLFEAR
jgi:hypothetical protein